MVADPNIPQQHPTHRPGRRAVAAGATLVGARGGHAAAAVTGVLPSGGTGATGGTGTGGNGTVEPLPAQSVAFTTFADCDALLAYLKKHARPLVGPYGLPGTGFGIGGMAYATAAAGGAPGAAVREAAPKAVDAGTTDAGTTSGTGTNVQVAGVDEADLAKRVGDLVYAATPPDYDPKDPDGSRHPALTVTRTAGGRSEVLGRLRLAGWQPSDLLVEGRTVLLVGPGPYQDRLVGGDAIGIVPDGKVAMPYWPMPARTRIVQVDVSAPAAPKVVRTLDVDGSEVGTRLVDGVARITVSGATNRLKTVAPYFPDQSLPTTQRTGPAGAPVVDEPYGEIQVKAAERKATATNRKVVAASTVEDWLPTYSLTEGSGTKPTSTGQLLSCTDVAAPATFSGLDTMSLLTFDLTDPAGIGRWDGAGVVASGAQLYATADHTYVATTPWQNWAVLRPEQQLTAMRKQRSQIHLFDTSGGASPVYVGSGQVPGFLLNQFSMDEKDGYLRVASTTMPDWWVGDRERTPSSSQVTVLEVGSSALSKVGAVTGLGKTETIRAVRFLGDVGYVVTYRQTDPLYTIDLSDPAAPKVAGELKILGYSAYLHPVGDGLVLGVGQDATKKGVTTGLQMALFDVSDPAQPRRVDQVTMPGAWSDVEGDHHAFTFGDGLALVPFTRWSNEGVPVAAEDGTVAEPADPAEPTFDAGVVAVRLTGTGAAARFTDPVVLRPVGDGPQKIDPTTGETGPTPLRTFLGDGSVWTVTTRGISAHDEGTLARTDWTRF